MDELEKSFKLRINTSKQYLRQIGINIKDTQGTYKSFKDIVDEIAETFHRMDENTANICKGDIDDTLKLIKQNDITKVAIMQNMVGIRYLNKLVVIINDLINKRYNYSIKNLLNNIKEERKYWTE